jgi:hypothetical protein
MWTALLLRAIEGHAVTDADLLVLAMPVRRMNVSVFSEPAREPTEGIGSERLGMYLRDGVDAPELRGKTSPNPRQHLIGGDTEPLQE